MPALSDFKKLETGRRRLKLELLVTKARCGHLERLPGGLFAGFAESERVLLFKPCWRRPGVLFTSFV
mgnify:CR=1 FL=1